ncbi:MAG TPA: alpha/beta hydrolase family protein [Saprospiraceae bacterium]|nr:alpha/beta hydrolase family protein [Saprospiraceae bacterium]
MMPSAATARTPRRMSPIVLTLNLLLLTLTAQASRVDTVEIYSPSMHKSIPCIVITPQGYSLQGNPYPTLYLLHGYSGHFASWLKDAPQLRQHADEYQMLIVCPDGGYDSWYLDSPVDTSVRYDTHISSEVVRYVDFYYHTRREPAGRAIGGLSMGGHGAMLLAARHPDVFGAAGSMAGGLDLRRWRSNGWDLKGVLGRPDTHWQNWVDNSAVSWVPVLKASGQPLLLDCGLDDFFLPDNREMHRLLVEAEVPHEYTERPGGHTAEYWGYAADFQLVFFHRFFTKN